MKTYNSFPDLARSFAKMKLQDKLDTVDPEKTLIGYSIGYARRNGKPLEVIANNIWEAYQDNPPALLDIVGEDTIDLIKKIYNK